MTKSNLIPEDMVNSAGWKMVNFRVSKPETHRDVCRIEYQLEDGEPNEWFDILEDPPIWFCMAAYAMLVDVLNSKSNDLNY